MFPSFGTIATDNMLKDFAYQDAPMDVSQNVAYALMQEKGAVVVDVRSKEEYEQGHIIGAYNIPLETLDVTRKLDIVKENNTPVLLYCRSGMRSGRAAMYLATVGFKRMMNFGGIMTWHYDTTLDEPTQSFEDAVKEVKLYQHRN